MHIDDSYATIVKSCFTQWLSNTLSDIIIGDVVVIVNPYIDYVLIKIKE